MLTPKNAPNGRADIAESLLPGAYISGGLIGDCQGALTGEEQLLISGAVEKRRLEFTAGRTVARQALAAAGCRRPWIGRSSGERAPVWPDGFTGSITHSDKFCYAVASRTETFSAVGIDIEQCGRISERMWRLIFNPQEQQWLRNAADPDLLSTLLFCAKEAVYKAIYTLHGVTPSLTAIDIVPEGDSGFSARLNIANGQADHQVHHGRFLEMHRHVLTVMGIPSGH